MDDIATIAVSRAKDCDDTTMMRLITDARERVAANPERFKAIDKNAFSRRAIALITAECDLEFAIGSGEDESWGYLEERYAARRGDL